MKRLHIRMILSLPALLLLIGIAGLSTITYAAAGVCGLANGQSACFLGESWDGTIDKCETGIYTGDVSFDTGGEAGCGWTCLGTFGGPDAECSAFDRGLGRLCGPQNGTNGDPGEGVAGKCDYGMYGGLTNYSDPREWSCSPITGEQNTILCSAGGSCRTQQSDPIGCDLGDVGIAGVCYTPSSFGSVLQVIDGKVGINNSTPEYALDVNGVIRAGKIVQLSDARLKSSIEKIDGSLEKISQIHGYQFTWKKDGRADMGVLAQEIEKVFSYAVQTDASGIKTVQYSALLSPIIEAIHELNNLVDDQSQKAINQSEHITQLEKRSQ